MLGRDLYFNQHTRDRTNPTYMMKNKDENWGLCQFQQKFKMAVETGKYFVFIIMLSNQYNLYNNYIHRSIQVRERG